MKQHFGQLKASTTLPPTKASLTGAGAQHMLQAYAKRRVEQKLSSKVGRMLAGGKAAAGHLLMKEFARAARYLGRAWNIRATPKVQPAAYLNKEYETRAYRRAQRYLKNQGASSIPTHIKQKLALPAPDEA